MAVELESQQELSNSNGSTLNRESPDGCDCMGRTMVVGCVGLISLGVILLVASLLVTPYRTSQDIEFQLAVVELITGSKIMCTSIVKWNGIVLTEDGQVCILSEDRQVNCIKDFHNGAGVRLNVIHDERTHESILQYLVLSKDGIVYRLLNDQLYDIVIGDPSAIVTENVYYAVTTWTDEELARSSPIKFYQPSILTVDGNLSSIGTALEVSEIH